MFSEYVSAAKMKLTIIREKCTCFQFFIFSHKFSVDIFLMSVREVADTLSFGSILCEALAVHGDERKHILCIKLLFIRHIFNVSMIRHI